MYSNQLTFEALVQSYAADLYRYAYWLCKQPELAEDIVQETFIRAWKGIQKLKSPDRARAWMFTILRREIARHFGKKQLELVPLDDVLERDMIVNRLRVFGEVENWVLKRGLKKLPMSYLEPLLLQVLAGYRCDEIADIMGISPANVMTRVSRARQQLRQYLTEDTNESMRGVV